MKEFEDDDLLLDEEEILADGNPSDDPELFEHFKIEVDKGQEKERIDKFLFERMQHSSRNRIQKAADSGFIHVNGQPVKSNYKVRPLDVITLMLDRPKHDNT